MVARLSTLLTLCSAAITVFSKPITIRNSPVSLSIARQVNITGVANVLKVDQARAKVLKARSQSQGPKENAAANPFDVLATNRIDVYTASVGVGSPPTFYTLIVDTGSSNTWIGAGKAYTPTRSSSNTSDQVKVSYGSGYFAGKEYIDQITLSSTVIKNQSIGVANQSSGFDGFDGILGIGPVDLTVGTTSSGHAVPTVTDNALSQSLIGMEMIGISFKPTDKASVTNGELTFGAVDNSKYIGDITYISPITSTFPASDYVGIDQSITYGSTGTTILTTTAGITDTGTTLVLLATNAYNAYQNATGAVFDLQAGLLKITKEQYSRLESLYFHISGHTYELTPDAQIWPRALNKAIGGDMDSIYLIVGDIGSPSGQGLDFIDGFTFLERYYYVYDVQHHRVGFAKTPYTNATTN